MMGNKSLRMILSIFCALCMLFAFIPNHAIAVAADIESTAEETVIEQNDNTNADEETLIDESTAEDGGDAIEDSEDNFTSVSEDNDGLDKIVTSHFSEYGIVSKKETSGKIEEKYAQTREMKAATSTNLEDFLTEVAIDAPTDENGNYIIDPNNSYEMLFRFSENEGLQFEDDAILTYDFPAGMIIGDISQTTFSIKVTDENGTVTVSGNTFEVVDGQLRVHFNQDDPNYERLKATANVKFDINISSRFDQTIGEITFSPTIVRDFVFEENADLTIIKNVEYDMDSDAAYYTVQVTSAGVNENVVIEDRLTGTALIFNQDVSVESSLNGTLSVTPDYAVVENGYQVTIPQLKNGEVLTIRYSAAVDNTKITGNGTVSQTNNTVQVKSEQVPDGKEASADFAGQVTFDKIDKTAAEPPVDLGGGLYEQTWTIIVNADHKMPMGGVDISDWISSSSRPFMHFIGDGINIAVTMEDGTSEQRTVSWEELKEVLTNSDGTYGWVYHTPDTDGKASYIITCKTIIDTNGALGNLTLRNGAQVYSMYDEGGVSFEGVGEDQLSIKKEAVGTTSTESEWEIAVTVPGGGLPDLRVVDDFPKITYNGQEYLDRFVEGSMTVDGLLEGESWKVALNSAGNSYTVTFYQDESQTQGGVLPTVDNKPREIIIRFKTSVNQEWLTLAADDGYNNSNLYAHTNVTNARSGSYRTDNARAYVIPIKPHLQKSYRERMDVDIDGVTYPAFRYTLRLFGPTEDGIIISDSFNTEYLKYYEAEGVQILGGNNYNPSNGGGEASVTETAEGMSITIQSFPKQDDGNFYKLYTVSYVLIVKDQASLDALNEEASLSQTGVDLDNTATWDDLESSSNVYYTYFPYVDKELLTKPTDENGYVVSFKVVINKYAEDLDPTSEYLTILDELSPNLRFIPDSVSISPANESIGVQHDEETNTLIFTEVPDNTTYEITYQARVLGSGNVTYSNTIKFGKYEKTIEDTTTISSSGGGSASNPSITLIKRDAESLSSTLAGATFQLFYLDNMGMQVPVQDRNGQQVTVTTGEDGTVLLVGNQQSLGWTLWTDRTYCLVETTPPVGYEGNSEPTYFTLTENPSSQTEYDITGDQLSIQNERIKISIHVEKKWVGPAEDSVTMQLLNEGVVVENVELNAENRWQHTFTNLPKFDNTDGHEIEYDVKEVPVPGYEQGRSGNAETGFTFTNTITGKVSIPVTKAWEDANDQDGIRPESVTVKLLADGEDTGKTEELNAANQWTATFGDLDEYKEGQKIVYTIEEVDVTGYTSVITGDAETGYTITNTHTPEVIDINGSKTWDDNDNQDGARPESITIRLLANGTEIDSKTVTEADDWAWSFTELPKFESGTEIVYAVTEDAISDYTVEYDGYNVTNTHTPGKTSVTVTKAWDDASDQDGIRPGSVTVKLLADGEDTGKTLELSASGSWRGSFTDLDEYKNGKKVTYTVEEKEVAGYTSVISGDAETGFTVTNKHDPKKPTTPKEPDKPKKVTDKKTPGKTSVTTNTKRPKTGDMTRMPLYLTVAAAAIAALAVSLMIRRRKEGSED